MSPLTAPGALVQRTLVTGGARSGKSSFAEQLLAECPTDYLATGYPPGADAEWAERIRRHQKRRPPHWNTIETLDLAAHLAIESDRAVLVDCVGLWLTRTLDELDAWNQDRTAKLGERVDALCRAVQNTRRRVVLVTNEVGLGVVPESASGRLFRDELGRLNARLAFECDAVTLCVCGIAVPIK